MFNRRCSASQDAPTFLLDNFMSVALYSLSLTNGNDQVYDQVATLSFLQDHPENEMGKYQPDMRIK